MSQLHRALVVPSADVDYGELRTAAARLDSHDALVVFCPDLQLLRIFTVTAMVFASDLIVFIVAMEAHAETAAAIEDLPEFRHIFTIERHDFFRSIVAAILERDDFHAEERTGNIDVGAAITVDIF